MESTCAVVVTYNRRPLLEECVQALLDQTAAVDEIIVVDNASTDGTADLVRERFPQVRLEALEENLGGAGGFHHGIGLAHALGHDWLWVMDDDTIPTPTALEALLDGVRRAPERPAMLASQVHWTDGSLHPMNYPHPRWRSPADLVRTAEHGLVLIRSNTFVSLLVARETVDRWGLPQAAYFIWGEDTDTRPARCGTRRGTWCPRASWCTRRPSPTPPWRTPAGGTTTASATPCCCCAAAASRRSNGWPSRPCTCGRSRPT